MALLALGRLRTRRGDPGADAALDEALTLASGSGTLQRLAPTACARAEAAFARGDLQHVRAEVERALPLAQAKGHPWFVGELAHWLAHAGGDPGPADGAAETVGAAAQRPLARGRRRLGRAGLPLRAGARLGRRRL